MKQFSIVITIILICLVPQFFNGCANTSRGPSGGPKDTIAPGLLSISPAYKSTGFKGKEIVFTFNEFVEIKDQSKYFTISPVPEKRPTLKTRGKSVVVSLPNGFEPNTTYYIDFGQSVVDLNESNPAEYLSTVFSTGAAIDTMVYAGRIIDALSFEPVDAASAFLYEEDIDSIPYQKVPSAMARTDKTGAFLIKGLKNKPYKLVIVEDKNNNNKYDPGSEKMAFASELITPESLEDSDSIDYEFLAEYRMFSENVRKQFLAEFTQPQKRMVELIFNQYHPEIDSFYIHGIKQDELIKESSRFGDTVKYWISTPNLPDSTIARIVYGKTDSLDQLDRTSQRLAFEMKQQEQPQQQRGRRRDNEKEEKKDIVKFRLGAEPTSVVENNVLINFETPVTNIDESKIILYQYKNTGELDSVPMKFTLRQDSLYLRKYILQAAWDVATKYQINIFPGTFTDVYSFTNDTLKQSFETATPDKFSSITMNVSNTQGWYIIQLMNGNTIAAEKIAKGDGKIVFNYLTAAKYRIRVIHDWNKNGVWDPGLYLKKLQPEPVEFIKFTDNKEEFELKTNWDIEQAVDISQLFSNE